MTETLKEQQHARAKQRAKKRTRRRASENRHTLSSKLWTWAHSLLLDEQRPVSIAEVAGRAVLFCGALIWGVQFLGMDFRTNEIGHSFFHNLNLVFHEAGHILCIPFGHFIMVLGGTLGQLLAPIAIALAFLFQHRDVFAASLGTWWFAQSLMDCAPYINDARAQRLQLLGGGTGRDRPGAHDWNNILGSLGLLEYDNFIAFLVSLSGKALMLASLVWGAYVMYRAAFGLRQPQNTIQS